LKRGIRILAVATHVCARGRDAGNDGIRRPPPRSLPPSRMRSAAARFAAVAAATLVGARGAAPSVVAGAIRWDAWFGTSVPLPAGMPGWAVTATLSPSPWHDRLPFYATVLNATAVAFDNNVQAAIDAEIEAAVGAGIDHFAFVQYPPSDAMSASLRLVLGSTAPAKARLRFCLIAQGSWVASNGTAGLAAYVNATVALFRRPDYVRVAAGGVGDRPVLYLFDIEAGQWGNGSTYATWQWALQQLSAATQAAGLGAPYLVLMTFQATAGFQQAVAINGDTGAPPRGLIAALSAYALPGGSASGEPYAALAGASRSFWAACEATGADVAPVVPAGWDRRPRVQTPVPWEAPCQSGDPCSYFYIMPQPSELGNLTADAVAFVAAHAGTGATATGLVLLSAWNEFDEGHYIAPLLPQDGGSARLDAIGAVLTSPPRQPTPFDGIVRPAGDGSEYAYLPPPAVSNHAAFVVDLTTTGSAMLGVAWFSGAYEEAPNCSIAYATLSTDGAVFSPGVIVSLAMNKSNQNPVLWLNDTGAGGDGLLHLWHTTAGANAGEATAQLRHLTSTDGGTQWTAPAPFSAMTGVFDRNRLIASPAGSAGEQRLRSREGARPLV